MSGSIQFKTYSATNRVHGVFAEINPQESGGAASQRTLILGEKLIAGTAPTDAAYLATGYADAQGQLGIGSVLSLMYQQYLAQDSFGEVWLAPLPSVVGAVVAQNAVTFAGTTSAAGTVALRVAGIIEPLPVASGTSAAAIATAWAAVVNADTDQCVTASANGAVVTLTARTPGVTGNEIDVRLNYLGTAGGEVTPPGLTVTIATPQLSGGAGSPTASDVSTLLSSLGEKAFDFIVCPYTDPATLGLLAAFLSNTTGRWSWSVQIYGHVFTAVRGTAGALTTFGNGRNEYTASCMGFYDSPSPAWLWAADLAGACATSLRADPGLPLQNLTLNVLPPPVASRFILSVRNTLLYDGISTFTVNSGVVTIDRMITFYQTDASGAPDTTWLNTETPFMVVDLTRAMRNQLQTTYGRKKLVADGTSIAGGSNMVTSQTILATALAIYQGWCTTGRAQNYAAFKAGAEADNAGGGRVNLLLPFILDSQLRQIVMSISFVANS